jgi:hypothetical protein
MMYFGETDPPREEIERRYQLSTRLEQLEDSNASPYQIAADARALYDELRQGSRWDSSRSSVTASVLNLFKDEADNRFFLKYTDISARVKEVMVKAASQLSPDDAQRAGVGAFKRVSYDEETAATTRRLHQSGGMAMQTAVETPEFFVDEAVRRGGQVKDVGVRAGQVAAPVGEKFIEAMDRKKVTNPLLGIITLAMIVFMKNKLLAIILIVAMWSLAKHKTIKKAKDAVTGAADAVTGAADSVRGAADSVRDVTS